MTAGLDRGAEAGRARRRAAAPAARARPQLHRPADAAPRPERELRPHRRLPGEIAFVSQSGALVTAMLDWAKSRAHRLLAHRVARRPRRRRFRRPARLSRQRRRTRAILLYIESVEAPRKFMSAARAAARNKPVIVVKAGRARRRRRPPPRTPGRWPARTSCSTPRSGAPACCASTRCRTCSCRQTLARFGAQPRRRAERS